MKFSLVILLAAACLAISFAQIITESPNGDEVIVTQEIVTEEAQTDEVTEEVQTDIVTEEAQTDAVTEEAQTDAPTIAPTTQAAKTTQASRSTTEKPTCEGQIKKCIHEALRAWIPVNIFRTVKNCVETAPVCVGDVANQIRIEISKAIHG